MKKLLFLLPILLMALACTPKANETTTTPAPGDAVAKNPDNQPAAAAPEVKLGCREIRSMDDESPLSEVVLQIGDKKIPVDSCMACEDITSDGWANYEIPKDAKAAVGGWWAGAGDYFYLKLDGADAVVMYGWADEQAEEKDNYQYKEIKRVKIQ